MKILISILLVLFAQDVYNQGTSITFPTDPVCVTCGYWPYTYDGVNCSCPLNSQRFLLQWPHDDHFHWGHCCEFKQVKCDPAIKCPQNQHIEQAFPIPKCKCVCNNFGLLKCYNLTQFNPSTCKCECPLWAFQKCAPNQYFDKKTCSCLCKEPCKDCSKNQAWNDKSCTCECPFKKSCKSNRFWNDWTCKCECKQAPRSCCPEMNKKWDPNTCNCVCAKIKFCGRFREWNKFTCQCEWIYDFIPMNVIDTVAQLGCSPFASEICNSEQYWNTTTCKCEWLQGWNVPVDVVDATAKANVNFVA